MAETPTLLPTLRFHKFGVQSWLDNQFPTYDPPSNVMFDGSSSIIRSEEFEVTSSLRDLLDDDTL
jgi:hypothetical protein